MMSYDSEFNSLDPCPTIVKIFSFFLIIFTGDSILDDLHSVSPRRSDNIETLSPGLHEA